MTDRAKQHDAHVKAGSRVFERCMRAVHRSFILLHKERRNTTTTRATHTNAQPRNVLLLETDNKQSIMAAEKLSDADMAKFNKANGLSYAKQAKVRLFFVSRATLRSP
jgi:hypothetical protein